MLPRLAKPQWQSFFSRVSLLLRAQVVEMEVSGRGIEPELIPVKPS